MSTADCGLIVFLRLPEKGKVKTRLAATTGDDVALQIYSQLTTITLDLASSLEIPVYLFYNGGLPEENADPSFHYMEQIAGDLGKKMESAIHFILQQHQKAIIIGSDCPDLVRHDIDEAIHQLKTHDFVIGPAVDGGFYLLGCNMLFLGLFDDIPWSGSEARDSLIEKIKTNGCTYCMLRKLHDIDVEEDWIRYTKSNL